MATATATILIGHAHQNESGIIPSHIIQFKENHRPALILQTLGSVETRVVIPTIENTIDDIYLMIAALVLHKVRPSKNIDSADRKSLYELFDAKERTSLYDETRIVLQNMRVKVVFNIYDGSHLLGLVDQIKGYPNDFEVTLPAMKKEFNAWSGKVETKGI
jgi:hypothetical protein